MLDRGKPVRAHDGCGFWLAFYVDAHNEWRLARDAREAPIQCETEALALSVARFRRRRLKLWR